MASAPAERRERIERLLLAARRLANPRDELGMEARARLPSVTGLSPEGVELAIARSLEVSPSASELDELLTNVCPAPAAHVSLSSTVFTAALRAIAIGLAASSRVFVRASRREPLFAELLRRGAPGLFELRDQLAPAPDDHVFAYGTAETLSSLRRSLPPGVVLHGHGPGFGVVVTGPHVALHEQDAIAETIALDVAVFDQRGCLSPRVLVVAAPLDCARAWAEALSRALQTIEGRVPVGRLTLDERAEITRYRDMLAYAGAIFPAGSGLVSLATSELPFCIAPVGRNLHVIATEDLDGVIAAQQAFITTYSVAGDATLETRMRRLLPSARPAAVGAMQSPRFDGPVDRRADPRGERL